MLSVRKTHLRAQRISTALKKKKVNPHESFHNHFLGVGKSGGLICIHTIVVNLKMLRSENMDLFIASGL